MTSPTLISIKEFKPIKAETRTPWQIFSAVPHRLMFFGGFLQLLLTIIWWGTDLIGRYLNFWSPLPTVVPSIWIHGFLMLYTVFIFFIFGFLMTTYPRWMRGQEVPYRLYVTTFLLLISGVTIIYPGMFLSKWLLAAGILLLLAGWNVGFSALLRVYYNTPLVTDKRYESFINLAFVGGELGIIIYLSGLLTEQWWLLPYSLHIGQWLFLMPILIGVGHRMIPYFSSTVIPNYRIVQPSWSLPVLSIGVVGHTLMAIQTLDAWRFIFDIPLMLLAFHHSYHWGLRQSFSNRLLAMLHVAFLWFGMALLLYNVQSLWLFFTGQWILGRAPLHALTIGFVTSLVVAMASRVTLGHSGRLLVTDQLTWGCFWGVSVVAVMRCFAELPPLDFLLGLHFNLWAALAWLLILSLWVSRYLPMILKPRVDGKPG
jgi:uncharacterized protein involved in response to NO